MKSPALLVSQKIQIRTYLQDFLSSLRQYYWKNKGQLLLLSGALVVGFFVRAPGILWGFNFPTGWYGHHVDEYTHLVNTELLVFPDRPPRWTPYNPYPKGMAAHVAVPLIIIRAINQDWFEKFNTVGRFIIIGRVINVFYGTGTILLVFLLARRLFRDPRVALLSAWLMALGGLHVSQSHFFVSDVPNLFWFLAGSYLLFVDYDSKDDESERKNNPLPLLFASAFLGISFGLKLSFYSIPALGLAALIKKPRITRVIQAGAFFFTGFILVNYASYTPYDLWRTLTGGISGVDNAYTFNRFNSVILYLIEMPALVSLPVFLLFLGGVISLSGRFARTFKQKEMLPVILIVLLPLVLNIYFIVFQLNHFPRHLIPLIPWILIVTAYVVIQIVDYLRRRKISPLLVVAPLFIYLSLFVYDGERVFIQDPRNPAEQWLLNHYPPGTTLSWIGHDWIPNYQHVGFPDQGRPQVVILEMHHSNHYLSGMSWLYSYPTDYHHIYGGRSQEFVNTMQSLFKGQSEYKLVAKFPEGYFMPEFILVNRLIGNRSRNYIAEVVIFEKQ